MPYYEQSRGLRTWYEERGGPRNTYLLAVGVLHGFTVCVRAFRSPYRRDAR
jgi:hypothetical protein